MSVTDPIPPGTLCENCELHEATVRWCENGAEAAFHGDYELRCECCTLKTQIEHAERMIAVLPELREKLEGACQ
jgi:hypothetical protein